MSELIWYSLFWTWRCGIRGGYMEVIGLDSDVKYQIRKMLSARLCSTTIGQVYGRYTCIALNEINMLQLV